MSCTIPNIENRYRQSNPELADKLNQQTFDTWNTLLDSKLFEEKNNELYVNKEGTKKRVKQNELIDSINNPLPKEGVDFVFESNPELANNVYEALGFKTESSSNTITRDIKEELPFKVIGNYNEIDEGLIGRKFYEEKIGNDLYRFEISNYSYPNEDGSSESFYDIDFTVNGSEEVIGTGFFDKAERAKQILQALLSQNFGNDTIRFNVEESKKGKQRLALYKRLMSQLGYNFSDEMEYALFYDIKTDKVNLTPQQKQQALQLYSQYLDTIFPDSKVKDIVYHGTNAKFDKFDKSFIKRDGVNSFGDKFYFLPKNMLHMIFKSQKIMPVILNMESYTDYFEQGTYETTDNIRRFEGSELEELAVNEPEQIHILGSKQDIENFSNFVKNSKVGNTENMQNYMNSKSVDYIIEKLIQSGKIEKIC